MDGCIDGWKLLHTVKLIVRLSQFNLDAHIADRTCRFTQVENSRERVTVLTSSWFWMKEQKNEWMDGWTARWWPAEEPLVLFREREKFRVIKFYCNCKMFPYHWPCVYEHCYLVWSTIIISLHQGRKQANRSSITRSLWVYIYLLGIDRVLQSMLSVGWRSEVRPQLCISNSNYAQDEEAASTVA